MNFREHLCHLAAAALLAVIAVDPRGE